MLGQHRPALQHQSAHALVSLWVDLFGWLGNQGRRLGLLRNEIIFQVISDWELVSKFHDLSVFRLNRDLTQLLTFVSRQRSIFNGAFFGFLAIGTLYAVLGCVDHECYLALAAILVGHFPACVHQLVHTFDVIHLLKN